MQHKNQISNTKEAFSPECPAQSYPKILVDYCCEQFQGGRYQVIQVYEEILNLAYWIRGFAPHNVMEIGTIGGTFFLLSRLATGKKVAIDLADRRPNIHNFMFGHEWRFFQGDSHTSEMHKSVSSYCNSFDLIFIDGDHQYEGVKKDFENYRPLLSDRGVIIFHDVDPDHTFKGGPGGDVWKFWADLNIGSKTMLCCSRSNGRVKCNDKTCHFGGIGIWSPN